MLSTIDVITGVPYSKKLPWHQLTMEERKLLVKAWNEYHGDVVDINTVKIHLGMLPFISFTLAYWALAMTRRSGDDPSFALTEKLMSLRDS